MNRSLLVVVVLAAGVSSAQRMSFPDFAGPGAAAVRNQVVGQACDTADCVTAPKVTTGGRPDLKKAKKESLQFFVTGVVSKKGKGLSLELTVTSVGKALAVKAKKAFSLDGGALSAKSLQAAMEFIKGAVGQAAEPAAEPKPAAGNTSSTTTTSSNSGTGSQGNSKPAPATEPERTADQEEPAPPPKPAEPAPVKKKPYFLAIELGSDILNKHFDYPTGTTTNNLRRYDLGAFPLPQVKVEFSPLALVRDDQLAGLGVDLAFGFAPFLKSRTVNSPDTFATTAMRFDGAVRWRLLPVPTFGLAVAPFVGVRLQSFTVGTTTSRLDGLPNLAFFGLRAGIAFEVPLVPDLVIVLLRFAAIPVFSSGEVISSNFFTSGSTFGLEGAGGLAVQVAPFLQLRATFEYTQYMLTFKTAPTDVYVATGAIDRYFGANAALRLQF
jgi:hypothetical protein